MDLGEIELNSVAIFSLCAVSAAREYADLVEAQISKAHEEMRSAALQEYLKVPNADEDFYIPVIDRAFERDYRPILRYTEVIYLFTVFETYLRRHVVEIQRRKTGKIDILKDIKRQMELRNKPSGLVDVAQVYFGEHAGLSFLPGEEWDRLREMSHVRNCIVHNAGVARDSSKACRESIERLEVSTWQGKPVGIKVHRDQGQEIGQPIIIERVFVEYCLHLVEHFFNALVEAETGSGASA